MDLNKVQIIGRVTQDVEMKQTPSGQNVTTISIATNRSFTDSNGIKQDSAEFHSVVLWTKLAEIADKYIKKGSKLYIEGRLQTRSWESQDGSKRYKTEIVGENMIMLDSKGSKDEFAESDKNHGISKNEEKKRAEVIGVEDIPF